MSLRQAMSLLNQNEWGYVVKNHRRLYTDDAYADQLDRLSAYLERTPLAVDGRFVRGYHRAYLGHAQAASLDLTRAIELSGEDKAAEQLLRVLDVQQHRPQEMEELPAPMAVP